MTLPASCVIFTPRLQFTLLPLALSLSRCGEMFCSGTHCRQPSHLIQAVTASRTAGRPFLRFIFRQMCIDGGLSPCSHGGTCGKNATIASSTTGQHQSKLWWTSFPLSSPIGELLGCWDSRTSRETNTILTTFYL